MNLLSLIPVILLLQASSFDMQGSITDVKSPSIIVVGSTTIELANVSASGLDPDEYAYLMDDIRPRLLGKDVLVKDSYVYFDLVGSYNSESINEIIQNEIADIKNSRQYICEGICPDLEN